MAAANVHAEPDRIVKALAMMNRTGLAIGLHAGGQVNQFFRLGQAAGMGADQRQRHVLRPHRGKQAAGQFALGLAGLDRLGQRGDQALVVLRADCGGAGHFGPFGIDPCTAQHHLHPAAARVGDDQHGGALLAGAAGTARTVLERLRVARNFDVDHQAE